LFTYDSDVVYISPFGQSASDEETADAPQPSSLSVRVEKQKRITEKSMDRSIAVNESKDARSDREVTHDIGQGDCCAPMFTRHDLGRDGE